MNQVMAGPLILFDRAEPLARFEPTIVVPVIAHSAHFAANRVAFAVDRNARTLFAPELMDQSWRNAEALAGLQAELLARLVFARLPVDLNHEVFVRALAFGIRLKQTNHDVPTATVDDVFHFVTVEMQRWLLILWVKN